MHCGAGNFKKQIKKADASGANIAILIGYNEVDNNLFGVKWLRKEAPQAQVEEQALMEILADIHEADRAIDE